MSLSKLQAIVKDREAWRATVHGSQRVWNDLVTEQQLLHILAGDLGFFHLISPSLGCCPYLHHGPQSLHLPTSKKKGKGQRIIHHFGQRFKIFFFTAALFTRAERWKQPMCPRRDEWIDKMWSIFTMWYYSALKEEWNSFTCRSMDELWWLYAEWNKTVRKREICVIPLTWGIQTSPIHKNIVEKAVE